MSIADEFPLAEENEPLSHTNTVANPAAPRLEVEPANWRFSWAQLREFGLAEPVLRLSTHLLVLALILAALWGMRRFLMSDAEVAELDVPQRAALAAPAQEQSLVEAAPVVEIALLQQAALPEWTDSLVGYSAGIPRYALLFTIIPSRPRIDVITYTVQSGDTVFGIAEMFGLQPETIFWGNRDVLNDNPHALRTDMVLNILPVDGTYHKWSAGESLVRVAEFYRVDATTIVEYPGNKLDPYSFDINRPDIAPDTYLIIPGGKREFVDWGPPRIYRDNPAVAKTYGPGHCGAVVDGAVGGGTFIWPTTLGYLSGYDYSPAANHPGIDIAGNLGNPVFAIDAGVVVYAGWSNYGYGNLIVLDHGNGWQSMYAHLNTYNVSCGQSVFQGTVIGGLGSTGNSTGPHLHFELLFGSAKVNPWDFMSP